MKQIGAAIGVSRDYAQRLISDLVRNGKIERKAGWIYDVFDDDQIAGFTISEDEALTRSYRNGSYGRGPNLYRVLSAVLIAVLLNLVPIRVSASANSEEVTLMRHFRRRLCWGAC